MRVRIAAISAPLILAALIAAPAGASSGSFSNAFATPDWKYARFTVAGTSTACGTGYCSYLPIVTAVPSLPEYASCRDVALDSNPNTQMAWTGSSSSYNANFMADVPKASILNGVYGQRLCLSLIGTREVNDVACEAQKKVFEDFYGTPFPPCPPIKRPFEEALTSVMLLVEPPPPVPAAAATPQGHGKPKVRKCPKGKRKVRRNGKARCVKIKRMRGSTKPSHRR